MNTHSIQLQVSTMVELPADIFFVSEYSLLTIQYFSIYFRKVGFRVKGRP
jgi:hypothetical protein